MSSLPTALGVGVVAALVNAVAALASSCFAGTTLFGGNIGALLAQARANLGASSLLVGLIAFLAVLIYSALRGSTFLGFTPAGAAIGGGARY